MLQQNENMHIYISEIHIMSVPCQPSGPAQRRIWNMYINNIWIPRYNIKQLLKIFLLYIHVTLSQFQLNLAHRKRLVKPPISKWRQLIVKRWKCIVHIKKSLQNHKINFKFWHKTSSGVQVSGYIPISEITCNDIMY